MAQSVGLDTVSSRSARLTKAINGKVGVDSTFPIGLTRDGLVDAFLALYDECSNENLKKDRNIVKFLEKFRGVALEVRRLQVNMGDFDVKKTIGRGHFGEVLLVREKGTDNVYAMKKIFKGLTQDKTSEDFYERERELLLKASGPWLTRLQYSFHDAQYLYLVMEFHPGGDMLSLMDRCNQQLPETSARFYLAELILAAHSVHSMGFVHRDIKPDNILLDRTGHIKLADFGSVYRLNENQQVASKIPVGTPEYIAPEVLTSVNGSGKPYGVKCDWWSVGIVFYEMLFGSTPFSSNSAITTYANILNFEAKLSIPDGASQLAVDVLKGLLTSEEMRFNLKDLNVHRYFEGLDWSGIRDGPAPYVPTIANQEDTSHFDEFDPEPIPVSVEPFRSKRDFSGKSLPYVGFTYNPNPCPVPNRSSFSFCLSPDRRLGSASTQVADELESKKKEVGEWQKRFNALKACEAALRVQVSSAQGKVMFLEKRVGLLEEALCEGKEMVKKSETEAKMARKLQESERKCRIASEEKAVLLVRAIERKYREHHHLTEVKRRLLGELESQDLESDDNDSTLKAEVHCIKQDVDKEKEDLASDELLQGAKAMHSVRETVCIEREVQCSPSSADVAIQVALDGKSDAEQEATRVRDDNGEVKSLTIELRNLTQELAQSKQCYLQAVQEISELTSKVDSSRCESENFLVELENEKRVKIQLESRILELETDFKGTVSEQMKRVELSYGMLQDLEQSLHIEKKLRAEAEGQLKDREEKWQEKLKNVEEELQEAFTVKDKRERDLAALEAKSKENVETLEMKIVEAASDKDGHTTSNCYDCKVLSARNKRLQEQLENARDSTSSQRTKYFDLQRDLRTKERDLKEAKLDLKIALKDLEKSRAVCGEVAELRERLDRLGEEHEKCPGKVAELQERLSALQAQVDTHDRLRQEVEAKLSELLDKHAMVFAEKNQLEKSHTLLSKKCEMLTSAFQQVEAQVNTYADLLENSEKNERQLNVENRSLELEINAKEKEIQLLQENFEKEREKLQEQMHQLKQRLEEERQLISNRGKEASSLRLELLRRDQEEAELRRQLDEAEALTERGALSRIAAEKAAEVAQYETVTIKEEATRHITALADLKRLNVDLQQAVEEREERMQILTCEIENLQSDLDVQIVRYETEQTKSREQIQQLNKLVLHLQSISEKKRKWPFSSKSVSNPKLGKGSGTPAKEDRRSHIRRMEREMRDITAKGVETKTSSEDSQVNGSSLSSVASSKGSHALEEVTKGFGLTPCCVCRKPSVHTGMLACNDCDVTCHRHCRNELKRDCGYRCEFLRRRRAVRQQMTFHVQRGEYGSWVEVPRRRDAGWERRYLSLKAGTLRAYESASLQGSPLSTFELCREDDVVVVKDASSSGRFIVAVFSPTTAREMRFMVNDTEEKYKWLEVLQGAIRPHLEKNCKVLDIKALDSCVVALEKENVVELKCCYVPFDSNLLLIGAEEGLFCSDSSLKKISSDSVHSFHDALDRQIIILVQGKVRSVHWVRAASLRDGNFQPQPLAGLHDCGVVSSKDTSVAVATHRAIYVLRWNPKMDDFVLHKEVTTPSHPCLSLQLSESILLYATNIIGTLVLDAETNTARDLRENVSLNLFLKDMLQKQKEPINIFAVDASFLLCFRDSGILLNGKEQNQIKWTQVPHGFVFQRPYLYICYEDCIEVAQIDCQKNNPRGNWVFVTAKKPRLLGQGAGGDICVSTVCGNQLTIHFLNGVRALEAASYGCELTNDSRMSKTSSEGEFSFTSSVLEVLEGDQLGETRTLDSEGREASM